MQGSYSLSNALLLAALFWGAASFATAAKPLSPTAYDWHACEDESRRLEIQENIPRLLLTAITFTETGRRGPKGRQIMSWPWTLHAQGKSLHFNSKTDAANAVRSLMARGVKSIDVGCMQINLKYHPHAFTSVEEALDPAANLAYGVAFLKRLKSRHKGWPSAIQHYHSGNRAVNNRYRKKVLATWDQLRRQHERNRRKNGISMVSTPGQHNELALTARTPDAPRAALLARRENRRSWTVRSSGNGDISAGWRDSMIGKPLGRLPFKEQRPHAQIIVKLPPWPATGQPQKRRLAASIAPVRATRRPETFLARFPNQGAE